MLPDRYYVAEVQDGPTVRRLYFYASEEGLTGPEYGYTEDDSWVAGAYESVIREIEERRSVQPGEVEPRAAVTVSDPREISPDELVRQDPWVNVYVVNAINVAKREIGGALHPIKVIWHWQTSGDPGDEAIVHLKLSDDTGTFGEGFSLPQLRDESLMRNGISRLHQDLLALRSRTLIMNLLRGRVGAGKD